MSLESSFEIVVLDNANGWICESIVRTKLFSRLISKYVGVSVTLI
jgi:hypothetical protein